MLDSLGPMRYLLGANVRTGTASRIAPYSPVAQLVERVAVNH